MPVIRVSDEVINILKKYAVPLEDTHDSVLRRILVDYDVLKSSENETSTQTSQGITRNEKIIQSPNIKFPRPQVEREARWIVGALNSMEGKSTAKDVLKFIEKVYSIDFTDEDFETLTSGETRWIKRVNWARYDMVQGGLLNENSPRGIWELTEKGKTYYDSPQNQEKILPKFSLSHLRNLLL
jgi:hypothetical protein